MPSTAQSDDVLRAVMILCGYDTASDTPLAFAHQSAHIHGCAALLGARGADQMRTSHGRVLFIQACVNVVSYCLRTCSRIPSVIHRLTDLSTPYFDEYSRSIWVAHKVRLKVTDCYCEYSNNNINVDEAVQGMLDLDSELAVLIERKCWNVAYNLPASERLPPKSPTQAWHTFQDQNIYHALCAYRIMVHLLIRNIARSLPPASANWAAQLKTSLATINEYQNLILINTPRRVSCALELYKASQAQTQIESQAFDVLSPPLGISHAEAAMANVAMAETLSSNKVVLSGKREPAILRLSRGYGLIWQLMLVGVTAEPKSDVRVRAVDLLRSTGNDLAIPQATILAERLEEI
ncbi:hypothetical protein M409DRAFT_22833 [Zasmidium cellare ATCC 36951]|uniref:Transcription factor domain-containing protein n=1 Tax=Zasmidium cellare ATCC 36951 TaxID=1080233 RepID=A0A6A6CKU0_ZASCE|nr:uncharacterized protein M409DRAFT_22833 [Zasmidium cellare ATCC 36951]KAF2166780.1 hypothetical protein M409DRAFT_22833 [Zasmidium cellare ATCC 36951]